MIIDGLFREFVGYLAIDDQYTERSGPLPIATVFFVQYEGDDGGAIYAVTAQHCLDGREKFHVQLRGQPDQPSAITDWVHHPHTDISVCRMGLKPSRCYPLSADRLPDTHHIEFGQQIFTTGLFSRLPGGRAVEPIARSGMIAMPVTEEAQIQLKPITQKGKRTQVWGRLIETISTAGQSGSPVFIHSDYVQTGTPAGRYSRHLYSTGAPLKSEVRASETDCALLGILHGHYEAPANDGSTIDLNAGIALVIPVQELWTFLMGDERLIEDRKRMPRRPVHPPKPDVVEHGPPFTKEDFENALKRASRRVQPSPPDEGKSGT